MYVQVESLYLLIKQLNMQLSRYRQIQDFLKSQIQKGIYEVGDYLPSEHELCQQYCITRTTARKALDELMKEGFIERFHGKGSRVRERRRSLGLLNVKGFSEAVGEKVSTIMLQQPDFRSWKKDFSYPVSEEELQQPCIHFERVRYVGEIPVMLENNWFSAKALADFVGRPFVDGSFFKTLSQLYQIEITGSEQELRAIAADNKNAFLLKVVPGTPILQIAVCFFTSHPALRIYAELYCNTGSYSIGNSYSV